MKELKQVNVDFSVTEPMASWWSKGHAEAVDAANRRGQFRLLIADPHLAALKKKKMEDSPDTGDRARLLSKIS